MTTCGGDVGDRGVRPDVVFNLCESLSRRRPLRAAAAAAARRAGIAYTGSPPLALGLALHKHKAKEVLRARGVPTPEARLPDDAGRRGGRRCRSR